jgi:hypothetical protein
MPKIIEVDSVILQTRDDAKSGTEDSYAAMNALQKVLKAQLDVSLRFVSNFKPAA